MMRDGFLVSEFVVVSEAAKSNEPKLSGKIQSVKTG